MDSSGIHPITTGTTAVVGAFVFFTGELSVLGPAVQGSKELFLRTDELWLCSTAVHRGPTARLGWCGWQSLILPPESLPLFSLSSGSDSGL